MNKTININIGGTFFHIDEEAFDELQHYLVILKKSFHETQGSDEIISDIEHRIAELFSERLTDLRQVINRKDVDHIIEIMGRPEEFTEEQDENPEFAKSEETFKSSTASNESTSGKKSKKRHYDKELFRDPEEGLVGGVLAGFAHYIGFDKTWVRIIWILLTLTTVGTFLLIYMILWAIVPEPRSTAERLKMKGERVNVSNIEKSIREEFNNFEREVGEFSDKVKRTDFKQMGDNVKSGAQKLSDKGKPFIKNIFRLIAKVIGIIILFKTSLFAIVLLFSWIAIGFLGMYDLFFFQDIIMLNETNLPIWSVATLAFLISVIPVLLFMILGLKLVFIKSERSYRSLGLSLLGIWILSIFISVIVGFKQSIGYQSEGSKTTTDQIMLPEDKPLHIMMNIDFDYEDEIEDRAGFKYLELPSSERVILNNDIDLRIKASRTENASIKIKRRASGFDMQSAKERAGNIIYAYDYKNETLIFDDYYIHSEADKVKGQSVQITLSLPENTVFTLDENIERFYYTQLDNNMDYYSRKMVDHKWKLVDKQLICLDCESEQNQNAPKSTGVEQSEDELGTHSTDSQSEDYNF